MENISFKVHNYMQHILYFYTDLYLVTYRQGEGHLDPNVMWLKQINELLKVNFS